MWPEGAMDITKVICQVHLYLEIFGNSCTVVLLETVHKFVESWTLPYFSIDNARVTYTKKRSKFVKNEHARYTLGTKKGKNLERLITATSQARF